MKAVLTGIVIAALIAAGAAFVLDTQLQRTAESAYSTTGVRL